VANEREDIKACCNENAPERDAEKILLGKEGVAEQHAQPEREQKSGLK
jgi:hypothetical protein